MNHCDRNEVLHPTRMDIPPEIRRYVIQLLNQTLACTVDLRSHVKQAGWNVRGQDFAPLQALFATMASELDAYADLMAERIAVLGGGARGTAHTAAMQSRVGGVSRRPRGWSGPCAGAGRALRALRQGDAG